MGQASIPKFEELRDFILGVGHQEGKVEKQAGSAYNQEWDWWDCSQGHMLPTTSEEFGWADADAVSKGKGRSMNQS